MGRKKNLVIAKRYAKVSYLSWRKSGLKNKSLKYEKNQKTNV